ncbi:hypothetical protein PR048_022309 [Dryococelus australis]|uniref:Uncharacterized protein n=1 Tax=Dryococelus australis TaxID=614101 RepID=A0ABQ9H0P9_9NEOP|nr:hypothetical protein PR048_022309 [Dryococelus australis]
MGFMPDDAAGQRAFSGISRFPRPFISVLLDTPIAPPSLDLKTPMLRAVQISSHYFSLKREWAELSFQEIKRFTCISQGTFRNNKRWLIQQWKRSTVVHNKAVTQINHIDTSWDLNPGIQIVCNPSTGHHNTSAEPCTCSQQPVGQAVSSNTVYVVFVDMCGWDHCPKRPPPSQGISTRDVSTSPVQGLDGVASQSAGQATEPLDGIIRNVFQHVVKA